MEIPVGLGLGGTLTVGEGDENGERLVMGPWVAPAIYPSWTWGTGESTSSTDPDMILGGTMLFDRLFGSLDLQHIFRDSLARRSVRGGSSYATLRFGLLL